MSLHQKLTYKAPAAAHAQDEDGEPADGDGGGDQAVLLQRTYRFADEPDATEIPEERRVKAYRYGKQLVRSQ